jgi:hypothetical protein
MCAIKDELDHPVKSLQKYYRLSCQKGQIRNRLVQKVSDIYDRIRIRNAASTPTQYLTIVCSPGAALALLSIDVELVDVLQSVVGEADVGPRVEGRHSSVPHAVRSTLPLKVLSSEKDQAESRLIR